MKYFIFIFLFTFAYTQPMSLTPDETKILNTHQLRCISTGLWAPFNLIENEKLVGIGFDYWDLIREKLDIDFRCQKAESWTEVLDAIKHNKSHVTIAAMPTPERLKYARFSKPYVTYPIVIATKNNVGFIHNIDLLKNKTIAIGKGYAVSSILQKHYPSLEVKYVESIDKALELVDQGKVYATIEILPVLAYKLNKNKFNNLKISGSIPYSFQVSIMINKENSAVLPLINKAIDSIKQEEKDKINARWIVIHTTEKLPRKYFYALLASALLILLFFTIRLRLLKKEIIKKNKTEKKLKKLVNIDSLTGVYNRYMLDMTLDKEISLARRYDKSLSVIFFDIDGFKNINDKYGHKIGDTILKELSKLVKNNIRESDTFGRWGGDEFLLILPETNKEKAQKVLNNIEHSIEKHRFVDEIAVRCSFGVTSYKNGDTRINMIKRVDLLFYESKRGEKSENET